MKRREFLRNTGTLALGLAAKTILGYTLALPAFTRRVQAAGGLPLESLRAGLKPSDAVLLVPSEPGGALSADFQAQQFAYNLRTIKAPQARIMCRTALGVAAAVNWARDNAVPFAVRCGGHSYEGFSQSDSAVVDVREMNEVAIDGANRVVRVGAGCALAQVYEQLKEQGFVIPAGSGAPVGVSGHTQGGGYGMLARSLGLACDSALAFEVVTAKGEIITASANEHSDLFWALRGGGGGSFGVVTRIDFRIYPLTQVGVCGANWVLPLEQAIPVMRAWQEWAPQAPNELTTILRLTKGASGAVNLRLLGQSSGTKAAMDNSLQVLYAAVAPKAQTSSLMNFWDAVVRFSGGMEYEKIFMKGKSDYVTRPMSDDGIRTLLTNLPTGMALMCDAYGGAIRKPGNSATAFAHRDALYGIQYYSQWAGAQNTAAKLASMRTLYQSMRPYVSGGAYVNYCDLDLANWTEAYWGANFARLQQVKRAYDPRNLFRHAQSIPV